MSRSGILQRNPYHIDLFDPSLLSTAEAVQNALSQFEAIVCWDNIEQILEDFLSIPNDPALELVLSGISEPTPLFNVILERFPTASNSFASSLAARLLCRLSRFFYFRALPLSTETSFRLNDCRVSVEIAPGVLHTLSSMTFMDDTVVERDDELEDVTATDAFFKVKPKTQKKLKYSKRAHRANTVDFKPFEALGVKAIPTTRENADILALSILQDQKTILEFYLTTLRLPDIAGSIKTSYIPQDTPIINDPKSSLKVKLTVSTAVTGHQNGPTTAAMPSAYPMVQPMKAALYFESVKGFGEWRILISGRADRDLREAKRRDPKTFKIIVKKIKELSNGHFSDDNQKRLNGPGTDIPIYEAKMTRDSRLVYQVDCLPEYDSEVERQVLKIFGIYTHAQLDSRFWDSMGHQLGRKGKEYRHRCTFRNRPQLPGDKVFRPASFPPLDEIEVVKLHDVPELPKEDLEEIHSLLILEKFVTFSQALLNSILADLDVAFPFHVSSREKKIIEHPHSCYVLGRSGTGKTTTMLFKMIWIERTFALCPEDASKPRQVFVTQSRVLAGKVEEYFSKLLESLTTASRPPKELLSLAKLKNKAGEDEGLVDLDDEANWRSDLPTKFSLLRDEHFPLFITFDRLCKLLEADFLHAEVGFRLTEPSSHEDSAILDLGHSTDTLVAKRPGVFVSYNIFLESYWPHFTQSLTKGLDPALVFSEFMGVIKGSEEASTCVDGYLDQQLYENLRHRAYPTFASQRNVVYSIFQLYLKQKCIRGDYDAADRSHSIIQILERRGVPGRRIDYLYVDEVQDNLLIDALLLRSLCHNADGLFWAGDTAQTISVGSSFRFNDLKAFLFRVERRREESNVDPEISYRTQEPPQTFQLAINYRSHGGIVNCAHSVIGLITQFWPYAIDILAQEQGIVDGLKPVFFSGWDRDTVRYEQFLFGASGSHIEFGAQQCILVRDEAARDKLREQVGDIGLIMTLYESKGLEFNDVLLYNFFEDSTVELSQWRVVLNALDADQKLGVPAPRFDTTRHAGVCSELKFLYVAITRARKNMWIVDCSERSKPMRIFWTHRNEVHNCTPGDDLPQLAVSSSAEEWAKSGRTLFQNKRYLQAMHCFERASLDREVAISNAYYLREQARVKPVGRLRHLVVERQSSFIIAAQAFVGCAVVATREKRAYFRNAADCFEQGGEYFKAAQAYSDAHEFATAAKLYRKLGMFDQAVELVQSHQNEIQANVADSILDVARLFYFKEHKLDQACKLFSSPEEALEYLEDYDLDVARATLLDTLGRPADAAELHLVEGRTLEAIRLFLKDEGNEQSIRRGNQCILRGLWQNLSIGISPEVAKGNTTLTGLLELATKLNVASLDSVGHNEICMFIAIMSRDLSRLKQLGQWFLTIKENVPALLCFDHFFTTFPRIQVMKAPDIARVLESFLDYARLLHEVAFDPDPCNNVAIQKLFGFQVSTDNVFLIPNGTYIHRLWAEYEISVIRSNDEGILVSVWDLSRVVRRSLCERLRSRVIEQGEICRKAQAFSPCVAFAVFDNCNRRECPREHLNWPALNPDWYNIRVRIHLQQVLIFHTLDVDEQERTRQQRYWINRLYEVINPPFYGLGTAANLLVSRIPEAEKGLPIVRYWARNLLYAPRYGGAQGLLTTVMRVANLSFMFDKEEAPGYIYRAPLVNYFIKFPEFRREGVSGPSVVQELMDSLQGASYTYISEGILFVRHVLQNRLVIDTSSLCDLLDYICGSLIMARSRFTLYNVTLPRSWFLTLLTRMDMSGGQKDTRLLELFVTSVGEFLERLHSGSNADHLLFENTDLSMLAIIRTVFIARVCRTVCLLGYNINNMNLRSHILRIIKPLRIEGRRPSLYQQYATANNWSHLARATQQSTVDSPMDEMIQLYHESKKPGPHYHPLGVRRVFYKDMESIPQLLGESSFSGFTSSLRPDAMPFVPRTLPDVSMREGESEGDKSSPVEPPVESNDDAEEDESEGEAEDLELDHNDVLNAEALVRSMGTSQHLSPDLPPSEEQVHAASVLQCAYRRARLRQKQAARVGLPFARARFFAACLAEARLLEWPHRYYRMHFLGFLPHILVCLDTIRGHALTSKEKVKGRWKIADHSELEELGKQRTEIMGIMKDINRLQKVLGPKSDIHRRRDLSELKTHVLEVEALIHRMPPAVMHELREDLGLGLKGIVGVGQPAKTTKQKPDLCMDDDM